MDARYVLLHEVPGQARDAIALDGPDTGRFLQGTVSADVATLPGDTATAGGLLTVKGKLVSEVIAIADGEDRVVLLVPHALAADVAALLEQHIIMDEVEVEALGPACLAFVWSDATDAATLAAEGVRVLATRHPAPGWLVLGEEAVVRDAVADLTAADAGAFDRHRVASASPAWGRESGAGHFPPEVGFVHAVSYDKGCYMGQEPLARIHARGQVNRVMVRVEADGAAPAETVALSHPDRAEAGRWTTAVAEGDGVVGLAIVRRDFASPGTVLSSDLGEVRVTSGPLGDDPGV